MSGVAGSAGVTKVQTSWWGGFILQLQQCLERLKLQWLPVTAGINNLHWRELSQPSDMTSVNLGKMQVLSQVI